MSNNKTSAGNDNSKNIFSPCFKSHLLKIDFIFLYWYFKICVITEGVLSDEFFLNQWIMIWGCIHFQPPIEITQMGLL